MKKLVYTLSLAGIFVYACGGNNNTQQAEAVKKDSSEKALLALAQGIFKPLPQVAENADNPISEEKVALGKLLYFDTRLSKTGNNSCNSCHNLATYGVDNEPTSPGDAGKRGNRNSPTSLNAALHAIQFWDGRAKDVEEQAGMPILNPAEMAIPNEAFLEKRLAEVALYQEKFKAAYPNDAKPINYKNIAKAIACFERTLVTPSKFDSYLKGDVNALTEQEKKGMQTFINSGCTACHSGATLGGTTLMKFGLLNDHHH